MEILDKDPVPVTIHNHFVLIFTEKSETITFKVNTIFDKYFINVWLLSHEIFLAVAQVGRSPVKFD